MIGPGLLLRRALPFALAIGIWFVPVPAGLTAPAWHLFAVFVAAIAAVLVGAFPLLTSTMLAVAAVVLTGTISPAKAFGGFANASVLLVVIAFLVAQAVVKSGLGRRISLFMVSRFGRSSLGLAYSIVLTDAVIAPAFPSNTARGGVLFPIVLSVAPGIRVAARRPRGPAARRLPDVLRDGEPRRLVRALDDGHVGQPDRHADRRGSSGSRSASASGSLVASVPALTAIVAAAVGRRAPLPARRRRHAARPRSPRARRSPRLGPLSRDERITAVAFVLMVSGWIFADTLQPQRDQHRLRRARPAADDQRADARRHRERRATRWRRSSGSPCCSR